MRLVTIAASVLFGLATLAAEAADINNPTHLGNTGNSKVNMVKAREYSQRQGGGESSGQDADGNYVDGDTVVHMGNASKGNCNMNVGGTRSGKDTVVTAKNIINVCR
jgi:hypothetical protein